MKTKISVAIDGVESDITINSTDAQCRGQLVATVLSLLTTRMEQITALEVKDIP